jgi:UDP-N-acetylmuramyl tripeptide synthase
MGWNFWTAVQGGGRNGGGLGTTPDDGVVAGWRQHCRCWRRRNCGASGWIASRFYGEPSRRCAVVGITGTDGKTSCAHFIAQALSDAETGPCGILGTLGVGVYGRTEPSLHTTPDPLAVQRWLGWIGRTGRRYAAMEVSSHALDQGRVNGVANSPSRC